jgi:hypothetical protein
MTGAPVLVDAAQLAELQVKTTAEAGARPTSAGAQDGLS